MAGEVAERQVREHKGTLGNTRDRYTKRRT